MVIIMACLISLCFICELLIMKGSRDYKVGTAVVVLVVVVAGLMCLVPLVFRITFDGDYNGVCD